MSTICGTGALQALLGLHEGQYAARAAGTLHDFQGRSDQDGAFCRKLIEIYETGQAEAVVAVHDGVAGKSRREAERLTRVRPDPFGAPADDISFFREERNQFRMRTRNVGT